MQWALRQVYRRVRALRTMATFVTTSLLQPLCLLARGLAIAIRGIQHLSQRHSAGLTSSSSKTRTRRGTMRFAGSTA